jgi:putative hemolysin
VDEPPSFLFTSIGLVAVVLLVGLNAFFVLAEFSLVAMRRSRVDQLLAQGHPLAPAVRHATEHLDSYLAACQLGITIASIGLGWVGEPALAHLLEIPLKPILGDWTSVGAHTIAVTVAFALITALHIIFGELMPKSVALQRTERSALLVSIPLRIFLIIFKPFILLFNGTGNWLLSHFGLHPAASEQVVLNVDELYLLLEQSRRAGILDSHEAEVAERALEFSELQAREVMVPRNQIVGIPAEASLQEVLKQSASTGFTRFPVYQQTLDNILGIVDIRHVAHSLLAEPRPAETVIQVMRPVLAISEYLQLNQALTAMHQERIQMAILVDEHGGTAGLVTVDDIVRVLLREMVEEFRDEAAEVQELPDGSFFIQGMVPLEELEWRLGLEVPRDEAVTIGGWVTERLGRIPQVGDQYSFQNYTFQVAAMDGLRVAQVCLLKGPVAALDVR